MDFKLEDKQQTESERLLYYQMIYLEALDEFSFNHPYQLANYEKEKMKKVIKRLFEGELDFLESAPKDYFDLYEE